MSEDVELRGEPDISEADIARLLDVFYARVRADEVLGPIFDRAVGSTEADWVPHMRKLEAFWSSVMRRTGRYHGDPFSAHLALPEIQPEMFERWLGLFGAACDEVLGGTAAQAFKERADRIAQSLRMGLFERLPARRARTAAGS